MASAISSFCAKGHAVQAQLHAQVAPGHHEGLGLGNDAIDVGQGLPASAARHVPGMGHGWSKGDVCIPQSIQSMHGHPKNDQKYITLLLVDIDMENPPLYMIGWGNHRLSIYLCFLMFSQ